MSSPARTIARHMRSSSGPSLTTRQKSECQAECQVFELRVEGEVGVVRTEDEDLVRDFLRPLDVVRDTHAIVTGSEIRLN